ncbi:MAG: tRNA (adenosine(37)-N6)-threonylcarbamoyltransferase complex dimerization subunit type 1 TsaB [Acidobacteria bacterium]|nr:tRNA (adenosine(37)-N6)-threonylcarbamoyltransferase complex dimerization subunit type 1 TsaB [Acidobacteriota bacterium]
MTGDQTVAGNKAGEGMLVLGVDTCGPSGTVALARVEASVPPKQSLDGAPEEVPGYAIDVLGQTELAGKTYSATLISAVEGLLTRQGVGLRDVVAIVVVNGPGSFTGVRVGLSAVKGLAEPGQIPVVAVSRLAVLAAKAGVGSAALDAHRHEVFLRIASADGSSRQLLAGAEEISQVSKSRSFDRLRTGSGAPNVIAVCDDAAAALIESAWSRVELVRVEAPTAFDAIRLCVPAILAGEFSDLAALDGHYLRRSDAEIFGEAAKARSKNGGEIRVRRMGDTDVDAVMEIAAKTDHAPRWGRPAYVAAIDPGNQPRRVALVAEGDGEVLVGFVVAAVLPGGEAELESIVTAVPHQRRGVARELFAALKHELRRQGVREVVLEVRGGNHSAQGFYRFLGFREDGRRAGYYAGPVEDAVLMRLGLR